jgi:hypothetical protein
LKQLHYRLQQPVAAAALAVCDAYKEETWSARMQLLQIAHQFFANDAADVFAAQMTSEQVTLLQHQRHEDIARDEAAAQAIHASKRRGGGGGGGGGGDGVNDDDERFVDISVSATLERYIADGQVGLITCSRVCQSFLTSLFIRSCLCLTLPDRFNYVCVCQSLLAFAIYTLSLFIHSFFPLFRFFSCLTR